ncbi:hypothetical protein DOTSEDRAFT_21753 [Dothistroma septosporum NZE10]|uniref:alkaline phosphatase n=1 Tax=Dothistroma septosporum (strain NZE10 / CBS 128990) TaxID=675120 RepID=N1PWX8_DOTSN|nr:hypothetical protein DOTSEDRAFT_21753 [Dothistroma septosporum NZE10]
MTHPIDTFTTDSAHSATALCTGHKSIVNVLDVHGDSSDALFDDRKLRAVAEIFDRVCGGHIGILSIAYTADATPTALIAYTRDRGKHGAAIDSFIHGIVIYTGT